MRGHAHQAAIKAIVFASLSAVFSVAFVHMVWWGSGGFIEKFIFRVAQSLAYIYYSLSLSWKLRLMIFRLRYFDQWPKTTLELN
jgi:hypothetical protein